MWRRNQSLQSGIKLLFSRFCRHHHAKAWVRVYVGLYRTEIVAYYWLSAQGVDPSKLNEKTAEHMGRIEFASCVYLGMLATKTDYQGNGIGPVMMLHAFRQAIKVSELVGIYAITLQAVDKRTADKYAEDFDFRPFDDGTELTANPKTFGCSCRWKPPGTRSSNLLAIFWQFTLVAYTNLQMLMRPKKHGAEWSLRTGGFRPSTVVSRRPATAPYRSPPAVARRAADCARCA